MSITTSIEENLTQDQYDSGTSTTYIQVSPACSYCGAYHEGTCPRVEELEYYPNGTLKRVRLRQETPIQLGSRDTWCHRCGFSDHDTEGCPHVVHEPSQMGHTCGVDCPQTVW